MLKQIVGCTLPVLLLCGMSPARAALIQYNFVGHVVAFDNGPLSNVLNPGPTTLSNVITGYLQYDTTIAPTLPGVFNLAGAVFHVQYPGITLDATGVTATVSGNRDLITFSASIPPSEFAPVPVTSATISLGFQTFTDNYFSLTALPTIVPPNDQTLGISYVSGAPHGASTDTDLIVTSSLSVVPEPASLALFGTGLGILTLVRRRVTRFRAASSPA